MNIGTINTTNASTGVQVAIATTLQSTSKENRPLVQLEDQSSAKSEQMKKMVREMQNQIDSMNVSLEFATYGEDGKSIAIVVADKDSGEVIREIPSKELQHLYDKMVEITGIIFNTQA